MFAAYNTWKARMKMLRFEWKMQKCFCEPRWWIYFNIFLSHSKLKWKETFICIKRTSNKWKRMSERKRWEHKSTHQHIQSVQSLVCIIRIFCTSKHFALSPIKWIHKLVRYVTFHSPLHIHLNSCNLHSTMVLVLVIQKSPIHVDGKNNFNG